MAINWDEYNNEQKTKQGLRAVDAANGAINAPQNNKSTDTEDVYTLPAPAWESSIESKILSIVNTLSLDELEKPENRTELENRVIKELSLEGWTDKEIATVIAQKLGFISVDAVKKRRQRLKLEKLK